MDRRVHWQISHQGSTCGIGYYSIKVHTLLRPVGLSQFMASDHPPGQLTDAACELCVCECA
jgi:hypothetical protein